MQVLNGFVKIHRKLIQWGWYKNDIIKSLFIHILLSANFKDSIWQDQIIKKGQFITSYTNLASDIGHTVQEVRTALKKLKSTGEITVKSTNKYTIITVVNWEEYQILDECATGESTNTATNEQQTTNKQLTNNQQTTNNSVRMYKNDKECKEGKEETRARELTPLERELARRGVTMEHYLELKNQ